MTTIPQRELRNNISKILRRAQDGERFTITVNGRPVAELGPVGSGHPAAPETLAHILADAPVDASWPAQVEEMRREDRRAARDPWTA